MLVECGVASLKLALPVICISAESIDPTEQLPAIAFELLDLGSLGFEGFVLRIESTDASLELGHLSVQCVNNFAGARL